MTTNCAQQILLLLHVLHVLSARWRHCCVERWADAHLLNAVRTCTSLLVHVQAEYAGPVLCASIEAVQGDRCNRLTPYDDVNTKDIRQRIKTGSIFA